MNKFLAYTRGGNSLFLLFLTLSLLFLPHTLFGFEDRTSILKQEVDQGIKKYRIHIRRLQHGIKRKQEDVKKSLKHERVLLAEIENIDMRLQDQLEKLGVLEKRMTNQKNLIQLKEKELDRAISEKRAVQDHLKKRINAYYKMGRIGVINVAFSTSTLPDLLQFHDSFQALLKYDDQVIDTYRHTIEQLKRATEALKLEETLLQDFIDQALEEKQNTDRIKQEKETLLSHIKSQTRLHQRAVEEMKKAAEDLTSSLVVLQSKKEYLQQGFLLNKGKLPSPLEKGKLLVDFEQEKTNKLGITSRSAGISINAAPGSKVRAIFNGQVIHSGYLRGYGNTVIIHHGYNYFSVTSRIEKILVKKGASVKTNSVIGITGLTANLVEDGVYLEIRHEKKILDPLAWINPANFLPPQ